MSKKNSKSKNSKELQLVNSITGSIIEANRAYHELAKLNPSIAIYVSLSIAEIFLPKLASEVSKFRDQVFEVVPDDDTDNASES